MGFRQGLRYGGIAEEAFPPWNPGNGFEAAGTALFGWGRFLRDCLSAGLSGRSSTFWLTVVVVYSLWTAYMLWASQFNLFLKNWFVAVTMVFGSFIAGSTSEGGGAVAFPVMTLLFKLPPECARNFSLAIQSVGMSAAAIAIWRLKIPVDRHTLVFSRLWEELRGFSWGPPWSYRCSRSRPTPRCSFPRSGFPLSWRCS